jgi:hypothetical protein
MSNPFGWLTPPGCGTNDTGPIKPTDKAPEMEQALTSMFGFNRRANIEAQRCCPPPIGCGGVATSFKDELSRREYAISGLCQGCQDGVFDAPELEEPTVRQAEPKQRPVGPNDFLTEGYSMICGSEEAEKRVYRKVECKRGVWLVAVQPNAAENVYFHNPRDTKSQGFGGRTLSFPLEDGTVYEAKGPWHGNADSLFNDTGVDVRNTHYTFVVLAMERDGWPTVLRDVVYKDAAPVLGRFDRYKELMRQYPQAMQYYSQSSGGSSCGPTESWYAKEALCKK